ncbi:MAG: glycosyltransferase [Acidobacteriota bacterium]
MDDEAALLRYTAHRMDLGVVIVNWNSGEYLARLLASLAPLSAELRSVVVVDNSSRDGSAAAASSFPHVILRQFPANRGFAAAANQGIAQSESRYVLLLNPDIEVCPEMVRELYRRIKENGAAAIGCARLVSPDGSSQDTFQLRPLPGFWNVLTDVLFLDEVVKPFAQSAVPQKAGLSGIRVEQPAAACWMLKKEAWSELGGFDESFVPAWFEDVDFCKRLKASRWEIRWFPDLTLTHRGGLSLQTLRYRDFISFYYGNLLRYLKKHHRFLYPLLWLPVMLGSRLRMLVGGK